MASLDMGLKSYDLTSANIDKYVTKTSSGNYALGYIKKDGVFIVQYVGRADSDVNARLKAHVGEDYTLFKFSYATSPKEAFETECKNYHDFGGNAKLNNEYHPDRPNKSSWKCPVCTIYD